MKCFMAQFATSLRNTLPPATSARPPVGTAAAAYAPPRLSSIVRPKTISAKGQAHMPASITAIHVDDSDIVRAGVKAIFSTSTAPPIEIIGEARSAAEALALCTQRLPQVVLLEVSLAREPGTALCHEILHRYPSVHVLVLTSSIDDTFVYEAVSAGAHGYLLKTVSAKELIDAVRSVAAGRSILDMAATGAVLRGLRSGPPTAAATDIATLSRQQRRVLELVTEGATNKEIGVSLGLSENTVRNYLVTVFEKLDVKTRAQAAGLYSRQTAGSAFTRTAPSVVAIPATSMTLSDTAISERPSRKPSKSPRVASRK
jgi:DNA-binding NarL/FixJ family response regulator